MTDWRWTLDEHPGPARRINADRANAMIDAALDAAALPERIEEPASEARRRGGGLRLVLAAAVLVFAMGGASAAVYVYTRPSEPEPAKAPDRVPAAVAERAADPEPELAPEPEPEIELEPEVIDPEPEPDVERPRPAKDLLRIANQQRTDRLWSAAHRTYRQIMRLHGGTNAAYVATLGAADIQLRKLGRPRAALRLYRQAVRAGGDLAQEARWGVVEAERALGDHAGERAALDAFLEHHADSPLADRARARRAALDRE